MGAYPGHYSVELLQWPLEMRYMGAFPEHYGTCSVICKYTYTNLCDFWQQAPTAVQGATGRRGRGLLS